MEKNKQFFILVICFASTYLLAMEEHSLTEKKDTCYGVTCSKCSNGIIGLSSKSSLKKQKYINDHIESYHEQNSEFPEQNFDLTKVGWITYTICCDTCKYQEENNIPEKMYSDPNLKKKYFDDYIKRHAMQNNSLTNFFDKTL